jgi:hypothetical protein
METKRTAYILTVQPPYLVRLHSGIQRLATLGPCGTYAFRTVQMKASFQRVIAWAQGQRMHVYIATFPECTQLNAAN